MQVESTSFAVMLRATFKDAPLTAIEYQGKPAWIASDVGRALGLTQHRDAARRLRERKKEGVYWHDLTADELEAVRNPCGLDTRVTSATLILEPGLYWLAMTSETKNAEAFREWLAETHLPALRAGRAAPIPEPPKQIAGPPAQVMLTLAREGTHPGDVFATSYLAAELARSKAKDRADRETRKAAEHADRVAFRRMREEEHLARRAKKAPPTTLW